MMNFCPKCETTLRVRKKGDRRFYICNSRECGYNRIIGRDIPSNLEVDTQEHKSGKIIDIMEETGGICLNCGKEFQSFQGATTSSHYVNQWGGEGATIYFNTEQERFCSSKCRKSFMKTN